MSVENVRCVNCAKRIPADTRVCPACGEEQPLHYQRIRCRYCGRRIASNVKRCPHCEHNPRRFYLRLRHVISLAALAILAFGLVSLIRAFDPRKAVASISFPTALPTATRRPLVSVVTATPSLTPVPTFLPTDQPAAFPMATLSETVPSAVQVTPTRKPSPTSTRAPTRVPQAPTPSRTPTGIYIPAPQLLGPADGESVVGGRRTVLLVFESPLGLRDGEWFRVEVDFTDRSGKPFNWCGWTRQGNVAFPHDYYDDSSPYDRKFRWRVQVAQAVFDPPGSCFVTPQAISGPSPERAFYWY